MSERKGIHHATGKVVTILEDGEKFGQPTRRVKFASGLVTTWPRKSVSELPPSFRPAKPIECNEEESDEAKHS